MDLVTTDDLDDDDYWTWDWDDDERWDWEWLESWGRIWANRATTKDLDVVADDLKEFYDKLRKMRKM